MIKLLVTGGSGFIGTNLMDALIRERFEILNIDKSQPLKDEHAPYWKQIDILDFVNFEAEVIKFAPEIIVHLAAVTDLDGKTKDYYKANTEGTKNLINIAGQIGSLKRVIFTSSMYVCQPGYIPKDYEDYKPHTLYGQSKMEGEKLVKNIQNANFSWTIIRPTSIWGPWFSIPYIDFFNIVYQGKYFDFGRTCTKTYGYVENAVFQIQKLISAVNVHGKTYYIGDYPPIQISEWANEISVEMGKGKIKRIPFFIMQAAALAGDILSKIEIKFPITSFRLTNMTTDNILPVNVLYELIGPVPVNRLDGVRRTLNWLVLSKGYKLK